VRRRSIRVVQTNEGIDRIAGVHVSRPAQMREFWSAATDDQKEITHITRRRFKFAAQTNTFDGKTPGAVAFALVRQRDFPEDPRSATNGPDFSFTDQLSARGANMRSQRCCRAVPTQNDRNLVLTTDREFVWL